MKSTIKITSLLTALSLGAALTLASCGKKTETTTTSTTETTPTTTASTAPTTTTSTAPTTTTTTTKTNTGATVPLSAAEKAQLTPVKTAMVLANTALKGGDVAKAKTQFAKVSSLWPTVSPVIKAKAGTAYPKIESGYEMVKSALGGTTPDKAKAGEGLTTAISGLNTVLAK